MRIILVGRSGEELAAELIELGHDALTAKEVSDVLPLAISFDPAVIWIEEPLPDATALELAFHLRSDASLRGVTIVKHSDTPWEEEALSSEIDSCITRESFVAACQDSTLLRRASATVPRILEID